MEKESVTKIGYRTLVQQAFRVEYRLFEASTDTGALSILEERAEAEQSIDLAVFSTLDGFQGRHCGSFRRSKTRHYSCNMAQPRRGCELDRGA